MSRGFRPVLVTLMLFGLLAVLGHGQHTAAFDLSVAYTGRGEIDGPFRLELLVSPPVSMPGQTLTLEMRLTNQEGVSAIPAVAVTLPDALSLDTDLLPSGTTLNLQTRELIWLPMSAGGTQQIAASLRVETAEITRPEREFVAVLRVADREQRLTVPVWIGIPPRVDQIVSPSQVAVGQPVRFRAEIAGSGPFAQKWDLGDGRHLDVPDPLVVYPAPGIYQVSLEAANPLTVAFASQSVTVVPHPAAQFLVDDDTPGVGQSVNFLSQSGGLPPLSYRWDFGDGISSDETHPTHAYDAAGTYQVRLEIGNDFGVSEAFWTVSVGLPPEAEMTLADTVPSGETVSGTAVGDESIDHFLWDMGDGTTYLGDQVRHIYRRQGDYFVSLSATNEYGSTQLGQWLHVSQGMAAAYLPVVLHANLFLSAVQTLDPFVDPLGIPLEPVPLEEPFVMEPLDVPPGTSLSEQLLLTINEARLQFDLAPLNHVVELTVAAQKHVDDMAASAFTAHIGSDGSFPVERLIWSQYAGGYAGEATAWGFQHPHQAVEFWVNSPAHRRIILNRFATDIGVGYRADFNAPNVWYWTAEFGTAGAPPAEPVLRLNEPVAQEPIEQEEFSALPLITDDLSFSWNWPLPLADGQRFVVYLVVDDEMRPLGLVTDPDVGTRYIARGTAFPTALDYQDEVGAFEWLVQLESESGRVFAQSERRMLWLAPDPSLPAPTPIATPTAEPTALPQATPTPTPTPVPPSPTPRPPNPTPPLLITATPSP